MPKNESVITPIFRVSFPYIFTKAKNESGDEYWAVTMIFDSDADLSEMRRIAKAAAIAKFPDGGKLKSPFRQGTEDEFDLVKRPEYRDKIVVAAKSFNQQPGLVDANLQKIINPGEFYAGCYAVAEVNAYAFDKKGNRGISFGLNNLMKHSDGEPLISRSTAEEAFAGLGPAKPAAGNAALFDDL
jgi:hypothetical protein